MGQKQAGFIDAFGEHVLPQLSSSAPQAEGDGRMRGRRHRRFVVEERRLLLRGHRDVLRLER